MKKYKRSELHTMLKECDVIKICEELYHELDLKDHKLMQSGDVFIMKYLRKKIEKFQKSGIYASIVIIDNNIPLLVIHRKRINPDNEFQSIQEIHIPYQGEEINQVNFLIYDTWQILNILSEDDYEPSYVYNKSYEGLSFI